MDEKYWTERFDKLQGRIEREHHTVFFVFKDGEKIAKVTGKAKTETGQKIVEYFGAYFPNKDRVPVETLMKLYSVEKQFDEDSFNAARIVAREKWNIFWDEFKNTLFEYHDIIQHPKREKFFEILRSNKTTPGEVIGEAEEWVELLK